MSEAGRKMQIDVHQHFWSETLLDALATRRTLPFVRRTNGLTILHAVGEQPYLLDTYTETPERRATLLAEDGFDLALVALSSAIGVEVLPYKEAQELIEAHLDGVLALPGEFAAWGSIGLERIEPDDVDRLLALGCVGVVLPAAALAGPAALARVGPLLERMEERDATLFVHPGPAPGSSQPVRAALDEPLWWRALTDYVAQMQAAWLTFAAVGRRDHPGLRVLFAMLAGGAPLISERLIARGGPAVDLRDPLAFYDTSSYGPAAVEVMARRVGTEQLVYGSDRPVVEPMRTGREAVLAANGATLIEPVRWEPVRSAV